VFCRIRFWFRHKFRTNGFHGRIAQLAIVQSFKAESVVARVAVSRKLHCLRARVVAAVRDSLNRFKQASVVARVAVVAASVGHECTIWSPSSHR